MPLTNSEQIDAQRNLKQAIGNLYVKTSLAQGSYVATTASGYGRSKPARRRIFTIKQPAEEQGELIFRAF